MFRDKAKLELAQELSKAEKARLEGYEGRARVCARRAAGVAIREYLALRGIPAPGVSAYDLLAYLQEAPEISVSIRQAAQRLTMQVSEDFTLPVQADLIEEARWLARALEAQLDEKE